MIVAAPKFLTSEKSAKSLTKSTLFVGRGWEVASTEDGVGNRSVLLGCFPSPTGELNAAML